MSKTLTQFYKIIYTGIFDSITNKKRKKGKQSVYVLDDGFSTLSTFHRFKLLYENNNSAIGEYHDTAEPRQGSKRLKPVYPLQPTFIVYEYISPSDESILTVVSHDDETSRDSVTTRLEDAYPQFCEPCMKIDKIDGGIKRKSRFQKFLGFCRDLCQCFPRKVSSLVFSAECQIDGVTTLHALQGDKESDTGVPDPIRKLRDRRAGCY